MSDKLPLGYEASVLDTEGTPAPSSKNPTSSSSSIQDTAGPMGGTDTRSLLPPAAAPNDTTGTNGDKVGFEPVDTSLPVDLDTTLPSVGGTPLVHHPYKSTNLAGAPASTKDTTKTDFRPSVDRVDFVPTSFDVSNQDTQTIGAPYNGGPAKMAEAVPAPVAVTDVKAGVGEVTVSWTASEAGDKVSSYLIQGSTGGTVYAGKHQTSAVVGDVVPSQPYRFRVAAINSAGTGRFGEWSDAVTPVLSASSFGDDN